MKFTFFFINRAIVFLFWHTLRIFDVGKGKKVCYKAHFNIFLH